MVCPSTVLAVLMLAVASLQIPVARGQSDHIWRQWGQWSQCSASCGTSGLETRQRSCVSVPRGSSVPVFQTITFSGTRSTTTSNTVTSPPRGTTECSGAAEETRPCAQILPSCMESAARGGGVGDGGEWSDWSAWTPCVRVCNGAGQTRRLRSCQATDGQCVGPVFEPRPCQLETTPPPNEGPRIRLARFVMGEENVFAVEGATAIVHCCADGIDRPVHLMLLHGPDLLTNDSRAEVMTLSPTSVEVIITPLKVNDTGTYSCFTRDNDPRLFTVSGTINVSPRPTAPATSNGPGSRAGSPTPPNTGDGATTIGGRGGSDSSNLIVIVVVPVVAGLVLLLLVVVLVLVIVRRRRRAKRGEQAVTSSNHIINQVDVVNNRKATQHRQTASPACLPYLSRPRQPLSLSGNSAYTSSAPPSQVPNDLSSPFSPKHHLMPTFSHPLNLASGPQPHLNTSSSSAALRGNGLPGALLSAQSGLGQSTHRLNVYSPAEAEREYSKSCDQALEPGPLDNGNVFDPNIRRSSSRASELSDDTVERDEDEVAEKKTHLKKIRSKLDDDDELFQDIAVACDSRSNDLNQLFDDDDMLDEPGQLVAAVSMELLRRHSTDIFKSPMHRKLTSTKSDSKVLSPVKGRKSHSSAMVKSVTTSVLACDGDYSRQYSQPSPKTQRCFEDFAKASVPRLAGATAPATPAVVSEVSQSDCNANTQSLPRTREHTDTLDRGDDAAAGNLDDTLQRYKGIMSPSKDLPVTVL